MKSHCLLLIIFNALWFGFEARAAAPAAPPKSTLLVDGPAFVREWVAPVYPPAALKEKIGGRVVVRIIVDENGKVTSARALHTPDPRLGEAAVAAAKEWKFSPATEEGKPVPICMDAPFEFDAAKGAKSWNASASIPERQTPKPSPRTAAAAKNAPPGGYPEALTARRLSGQVAFACVVQPDGRAQDLRVIAASHSDFVLPALDALNRWEFSPASQGDLTVSSELRGTVSFDSVGSSRAEVLAANGIAGPDGSVPLNQPLLEAAADVVFPYDLLLRGEGGHASAEFTVSPRGTVTEVKIREASRPEFGHALRAALEQWAFSPAMAEGHTIASMLVKRAEFKAIPVDAKESGEDPVARLLKLESAGAIRGGAGLDEKLTPLYRVAPPYPAALAGGEKPPGQAVIEFVIDRDGRARLPRVVSCTREEFGWAAATAVAQWIFKVPMRDGKPTEVKVKIPMNFAAPPV